MLNTLKQWQEKIDECIIRERVLIFLSAIAIVFMLWNFIIQAPFDKKMLDIKTQLTVLATQRTDIQTQLTGATQSLLNDPDRIKAAQITQLKTDIETVEEKIQKTSQSLIKADQLPQVLQEVLQKTAQLTLLEVTTLPAHELQLGTIDDKARMLDGKSKGEMKDTKNVGVYEHVVELRVAGNYFQIVQFLTTLEALPWRFYWQRLDYTVTQYPNAEIVLRVYTLSSEEGLLGV